MGKKLNETIGTVEYDGLFVSESPTADVVTIKLAAGSGVLKRGTVVTGTPGSELSVVSGALESANGAYILTDDVDISAATVTTAYRTGHFARNLLTTDGSYILTAADEEVLRNAGILLSDAMKY